MGQRVLSSHKVFGTPLVSGETSVAGPRKGQEQLLRPGPFSQLEPQRDPEPNCKEASPDQVRGNPGRGPALIRPQGLSAAFFISSPSPAHTQPGDDLASA